MNEKVIITCSTLGTNVKWGVLRNQADGEQGSGETVLSVYITTVVILQKLWDGGVRHVL
jgi:hypothetical protein